jgi:hypothetical protein
VPGLFLANPFTQSQDAHMKEPQQTTDSTLFKDLGDDLILRTGTPADAEKLARFNADVHGEDEQDAEAVAEWTRDLFSGKHPTTAPGDFTIIEERSSGKIISSSCLISQTWSYGGIPLKVGRPELVGTDPGYRNRGLVRQQFEVMHRWSQQRGEVVQAITGIPYYYRLFDYEMAMNLGGSRLAYPDNVPQLKEDQAEAVKLRAAELTDIPFIQQVYALGASRSLVSVEWDEALWRYELTDKSPMNVNRLSVSIIETPAGEPVGFITCPYGLWGTTYALTAFELIQGQSWFKIAPSVMRYVLKTGQAMARAAGKELASIQFELGETHPAYDVLKNRLPVVRKPYAWYLRVPDLIAFLNLIGPVLEKRLSESLCSGYSGEIKIGFYRDGLRMVFEEGRLRGIEPWQKYEWHEATLLFSGFTFLQLLFGYRDMEELRHAMPDSSLRTPDLAPVIAALFPRQPSHLLPIS